MAGAAGATPYRLAQTLQPNEPLIGDYFGSALAFDGDLIAIKSQSAYDGDGLSVTHFFTPEGDGRWSETFTYRFDSMDNDQGNFFIGEELAIEDETVIVSYGDNAFRSSPTPFQVFTRNGAGWDQNEGRLEVLTREDRIRDFAAPSRDRNLGRSVDLSGDFVIADASSARRLDGGVGTARVFQRTSEGHWDEVANLNPDDAGFFSMFSVAIDGTTAMVGRRSLLTPNAGAYFFERDPSGSWSLSQELSFGEINGAPFVELDGQTAVVVSGQKPVRTYRKQNGVWVQVPSPTAETDYISMAIEDGVLALGARQDENKDGRVELYEYSETQGWLLRSIVHDPDPQSNLGFATKIALDDGRLLVGAPGSEFYSGPAGSGDLPGRAYLFVPVPEPTAATMLLLATLASAAGRRRG